MVILLYEIKDLCPFVKMYYLAFILRGPESVLQRRNGAACYSSPGNVSKHIH